MPTKLSAVPNPSVFDFGFAGADTVDGVLAPLRERVEVAHRADEASTVLALAAEARFAPDVLRETQAHATKLAEAVRRERSQAGGVDALMLEFSLDSREGVALMCVAEALLRIPDAATRDRLIRDKIGRGDWRAHVGVSPSLFVNAAAWGLLVTGKLVDTRSEGALEQALVSLLRKGGEPLIRKGVDLAMRLLGRQFVTGRTIDEALRNAREREAQGYTYSFDMLGEAALTADDAQRFFEAYEAAIHAIGKASAGRGVVAGPGVSVKLSALHPRYSRAQRARVMAELTPRVLALMRLSKHYDIGFAIDAEEADRLEISLDVLAALIADPALADWDGLGFVVQAYQKRARPVIDWLVALARQHRRRLMLRLVKGAYWDSEIKRAQVEGMPDYPVFTRKVHTDVAYLACAKAMLAAPDALYSQFATHNAFTIAAIRTLSGAARFEFQCLHGMGESIYDQLAVDGKLDRPCRIYAPVGSHETLLAYLVRRLLENGANSSFVNRIVDPAVPIASLVEDPIAQALKSGGAPHANLPAPTLPSMPMLTYGDEIGMEGAFGEDGRRPMPWDEQHWDARLLAVYRDLIAARRGSVALREGGLRWVHAEGDAIVFLRETVTETALVHIARRAHEPVRVDARHLAGVEAGRTAYGQAPDFADGTVTLSAAEPGVSVWTWRPTDGGARHARRGRRQS